MCQSPGTATEWHTVVLLLLSQPGIHHITAAALLHCVQTQIDINMQDGNAQIHLGGLKQLI